MKSKIKLLGLILLAAAAGGGFFSCNTQERRTAQTAYAESGAGIKLPSDAVTVLEAMQNVFRAVSDSVLPSVVELDVVEKRTGPANPFGFIPFLNQGNGEQREYEQQGLGSGVIVRKSGKTYYVLTNNHVAGKATEISVKLKDGREITGRLVGADERKDIALVSFESDDGGIPIAVLGDSDTVRVGDICFAMGTPLGFDSSVTQGIVSAIGRSGHRQSPDNISEFIQTDAAINQGNSGGPLVNIYGEVIGINTWIASPSGGSAGLGFAITINNVKKAIDDFIAHGKVTYGWMGVALVEVNDEYKRDLGVGARTGAFAAQVYLDSPAAKGGILPGDFVIQLNGREVKSVNQLVREVGDLTVGEKAVFVVLRDGKEATFTVSIEARKDETASNSVRLWPGFTAIPLTEDVRKELKLDAPVRGVVVANVQPRSPAAAMRLNAGEVITAVNDKKVASLREFYNALNLTGKTEVWFDVRDADGNVMSTSRYKLR